MIWLPRALDAFTFASGVSSLAGLGVSAATWVLTRRVRAAVDRVRREMIAKVRTGEAASALERHARALKQEISKGDAERVGERCMRIAGQLEGLERHLGRELGKGCRELAGELRSAAGRDSDRIIEAATSGRLRLRRLLELIESDARDRELGEAS